MSNNNLPSRNTVAGGITFSGLLTIVFITLRLTGYIDWNWWVFSPLWIPAAIVIAIIVIVVVIAVIVGIIQALR